MLSIIFWNLFGFARFADWPDALSWVCQSTIFAVQETLDHNKVTSLPDRTPVSFPARKPATGPGRPAGGLTTYFDNGRLGGAQFTKIHDQQFLLCVRVTLSDFLFIIGNIYAHIHTKGRPDNLIEEIQVILDSIAESYPTDPFIFGGDFNSHYFSDLQEPHELQFRHLAQCFKNNGFKMFPEQEEPFTFHKEGRFVTLDYVFVRGVQITKFEVAEEYSSVTNHRPLVLEFAFPSTPDPVTDMELSPAWGTAYW